MIGPDIVHPALCQMSSQFQIPLALATIAFVATLVLTPIVRAAALHFGVVDRPGELKIHTAAIPRLGGIAMVFGLGLAVAIAPAAWRPANAVLFILGITWLLGATDDLKSIPAIGRLVVQLAAGSLLWFANAGLNISGNGFVDVGLTALFFSFTVNAWNLLDGMDGLALSVSAVAALGFAALFYSGADRAGLLLSSLTFSVCVAALFYNRPPASIFIGDSGSTLLGAIFAILSLGWVHQLPATRSLFVPLLFVAIPLGDAVAAMIRRLRAGKSPFSGDRSHFYDLLRSQNWTVPLIVIVSAAATAGFAGLGIVAAHGIVDPRWIAIAAAALICVLGLFIGSFAQRPISPSTLEDR